MKIGDRWVVFFAAALFVASQLNIVLMLAPLEPSVFALQLAFTAASFWSIVEAWGDAGLALYRAHFVFDNLHPFIYGAFGYLLVARSSLFAGLSPAIYRAALLMLPLAGVFDLCENAAHIYLLAQDPGSGALLIALSASCALLKWALALLFALVVLGQLARRAWAGKTVRR
ncbi:hypothetical protein [Dechloromonas denitrificans]|uniref:hypothetical protein n=1 Tax=Dechloromonas denitrificans TaxID=281362 RepID=UPI001CFB174F|nr:hypothetical protein [Dechloromonas denitrificans]UCV09016.1 hypothetical protein KI615_05670 [Dechloromonas denitrificans]